MKPGWKIFAVALLVCAVCAATFASMSESRKKDDTKQSAKQVKATKDETVKSEQKFGEWTYLCKKKEDGGDHCFLVQDRVIEGKGLVLRLLLGRFGVKGEMVLKALTPLGIYLPVGVAYKIDENQQAPMVVQNCTAEGCEAVALADEKLLKDLKGGKKIVIGFTSRAAGKTIGVDAKLEGLIKGLDALDGK